MKLKLFQKKLCEYKEKRYEDISIRLWNERMNDWTNERMNEWKEGWKVGKLPYIR